VERQKEYARLRTIAAPDLDGESAITWWERRRLAKLEKLPRIYIDDFDPTPSDEGGPLNPNSYNLNLAEELLVYNLPVMKPEARFSPLLQPEDWEEYALDVKRDNPTKRLTIPPQGLILQPDRLYLARTLQHTGSWNVRPCLNGRSSIGRLGICIHITAGYGDVGFEGTWTLELMVIHPVKVYPRMGICQIDYATVSPRHRPYRSKKYQGQKGVTASRLYMEFPDVRRGGAEGQKPTVDLRPGDVPGEGAAVGDRVRAAAQ
jgi:dCTP deaminase